MSVHVLLVGIDDYGDRAPPLFGCARDIGAAAEYFENHVADGRAPSAVPAERRGHPRRRHRGIPRPPRPGLGRGHGAVLVQRTRIAGAGAAGAGGDRADRDDADPGLCRQQRRGGVPDLCDKEVAVLIGRGRGARGTRGDRLGLLPFRRCGPRSGRRNGPGLVRRGGRVRSRRRLAPRRALGTRRRRAAADVGAVGRTRHVRFRFRFRFAASSSTSTSTSLSGGVRRRRAGSGTLRRAGRLPPRSDRARDPDGRRPPRRLQPGGGEAAGAAGPGRDLSRG